MEHLLHRLYGVDAPVTRYFSWTANVPLLQLLSPGPRILQHSRCPPSWI